VVSTIKDELYYGYKLMIVEYLDENCEPAGAPRVIAFDAAHAGVGDIVLVNTDGYAAMVFLREDMSGDLTICGVLDSFSYDGKTTELH
jgi:microcompartment protein CcmK/EutM